MKHSLSVKVEKNASLNGTQEKELKEEAEMLAQELRDASIELNHLEKRVKNPATQAKAKKRITARSRTDSDLVKGILEIGTLAFETYLAFNQIQKPEASRVSAQIETGKNWWEEQKIRAFCNLIAIALALGAMSFLFTALYLQLKEQLGVIPANWYLGLALLCCSAITVSIKSIWINRK